MREKDRELEGTRRNKLLEKFVHRFLDQIAESETHMEYQSERHRNKPHTGRDSILGREHTHDTAVITQNTTTRCTRTVSVNTHAVRFVLTIHENFAQNCSFAPSAVRCRATVRLLTVVWCSSVTMVLLIECGDGQWHRIPIYPIVCLWRVGTAEESVMQCLVCPARLCQI